ncbi:hypothetical protein SJDPG11_03415 [Porphyromonas gingivalis SJD11]|nr:hypothetical protein SJDPG11_03415 [Porphyromonas gingivalis SJD11]
MIPNLSSLLKSFLVRIWWLLGIKKRRRWRLFLWGKEPGRVGGLCLICGGKLATIIPQWSGVGMVVVI